jgi:hypothetical protein
MRLRDVRNLAGVVAAAAAGAAAVVLVGRSRFDRAATDLVDRLFARASAETDRVYTHDDVAGLPDPVRRYFEHVLTEGRPYVRTARLEQSGEFRLGDASSPWRPLTAVQQYTVDPPGFVWDAEIAMAPLVSVRVVDAYTDGSGSLRAAALGAFPVADSTPTPELDAGELTRYLAESVWFPTALLPAEGVTWEGIDDDAARATLEHEGTTASLVFHFSDEDEVARVTAERRPRAVDGGYEEAQWTGHFRNYRDRDGMRVPVEAEVEWNLPEGDLTYWRARVPVFDYHPSA